MKRTKRRCGLLFFLFVALSVASAAQVLGGIQGPIPEGFKPSMNARLAQFIQAQVTDDWEQIAAILGPYRHFGDTPYTKHYKECLISQMRTARMTSFIPNDKAFSAQEPMSAVAPAGWVLRGNAIFKTTEGDKKQPFAIRVYRYEDEWYFVPNYDHDWDKVLLTKARLKADHADEILVRNETTSPVQISNLHAFISREYPSILHLRFRLNNVSRRTAQGYGMDVGDALAATSFSTPEVIEPGRSVEVTKLSTNYHGFDCEDHQKDSLIVTFVWFANDEEWKTPMKR